MKVKQIIIHNLKKEQQQRAELIISANALDPNDKKVISLVEELNSRFKADISHGVFSEQDGDADSFQKEFKNYLVSKKATPEKRFIDMTVKTINFLHSRVDSIQAAKGGYILYVDYEPINKQHYFSVFLIRDITGKVFEFNKNIITVGEIIHADTANLAMACRINIEKYKNHTADDKGSYLGFISVKQPETSKYFIDWIGAERVKRNKEDSKNLVTIITKMDPPVDDDGNQMSREDFNQQVYDAIKAFGKNDINVNALSATIFKDSAKIMDYAEENDIELATDFYPDNTVLKRLFSHSATGEGIRLKYPPHFFGNKIKVDKSKPNTIIIKSKSLVDSILKEESKG